jgi:methionyl-tRNA formyltransferase
VNILYAGSPDISAKVLEDLYLLTKDSSDFKIVGVLTNPPSAKGRHKELIPTDVAQTAIKYEIPVLEPEKLDAELREKVQGLNPDILVCFAYGKIFGPKFMALFPKGGINLHPSLLPKYRGCAPVPAAILNQETETGITVQKLALEMDSGDILLQTKIPLDFTETSESLLNKAAAMGGELLFKVLNCIKTGGGQCTPQDSSQATYCEMLKKEDGLIDWSKPAKEICAKIRAFYPWPSSYTFYKDLQLKIHEACVFTDFAEVNQENISTPIAPGTVFASDKNNGILIQTGEGILAVKNLQLQAKKAMNYKDFLNGNKDFIGTKL